VLMKRPDYSAQIRATVHGHHIGQRDRTVVERVSLPCRGSRWLLMGSEPLGIRIVETVPIHRLYDSHMRRRWPTFLPMQDQGAEPPDRGNGQPAFAKGEPCFQRRPAQEPVEATSEGGTSRSACHLTPGGGSVQIRNATSGSRYPRATNLRRGRRRPQQTSCLCPREPAARRATTSRCAGGP